MPRHAGSVHPVQVGFGQRSLLAERFIKLGVGFVLGLITLHQLKIIQPQEIVEGRGGALLQFLQLQDHHVGEIAVVDVKASLAVERRGKNVHAIERSDFRVEPRFRHVMRVML